MGTEIDSISLVGGKWPNVWVGDRILLAFCLGGGYRRDFSVGRWPWRGCCAWIGIELFYYGDRKVVGFSVWIKIAWFLCRGMKFTWFKSGDRVDLIWVVALNYVDFVWVIELDFVMMLRSKLTRISCGGSKLTLCGPNLTCFYSSAVRGWLSFVARIPN